jgi:hypothetical protein
MQNPAEQRTVPSCGSGELLISGSNKESNATFKVILSCRPEIPTGEGSLSRVYFQQFKSGSRDATKPTDEVARNGALSRITSARGFLERPLLFAARKPTQRHS